MIVELVVSRDRNTFSSGNKNGTDRIGKGEDIFMLLKYLSPNCNLGRPFLNESKFFHSSIGKSALVGPRGGNLGFRPFDLPAWLQDT